MEYEYVLFRCEVGENCKCFPILKSRWCGYGDRYVYYKISFIPKKELTNNTIECLTSLGLIEYLGNFDSDDSFFDYYYEYYSSYCIVYNYKIKL